MQIVVFFFVEDIEATFSLPAVLVVTLLLRVVLVFVHSGECEREVVFGVGVEVIVVLGYCLPQLLFLKLPDVQLLTRIRKYVNAARQIDSGLRQTPVAQFLNLLYI